MLLLLRKIHRLLYFISVLFFFILCYPLLFVLSRNPHKNYAAIVWFRKWISVLSVHLVGIRFKINYEEPIDWSQPYIICPNHTSILDITALTYLCPQQFSFMGKIELLKNPVTRIFFKSIDIPVKRESKISAFKAFKRGLELLQEKKSLVIFPEGAIEEKYPPTLHKFKPGAFRMAQENHTAILPVIIHNAWKIMWDDGRQYGSKPGLIEITILKPIHHSELENGKVNGIETEVYEKMNKVWIENLSKY
ncbi:1-acyl-sn-glycerol-3-phosphate acyltransferase [Sphingobacterium sp. DK4209]|uniref:1-acyl-sn-glycerol-3-phosphate acyltransferase n=1 Tax=Sphingobacterium zhuxiongii TaxID=2662364 RepID=A0A5Q0Q912_9SPHI|nr:MULTISPECIES: lysophospholipid acyltransferase family protein [unclassified Sphingobacterium]MVZ65003.1 1-acyl-sn-glycerol-3-phosphate acyltransferase [Sphingobacterium sp. DK4209]QGA25341.1 1-acyl-sn-glycerol-3-phosphate acyltransferase [Sphingobacterium sp. dk4302]